MAEQSGRTGQSDHTERPSQAGQPERWDLVVLGGGPGGYVAGIRAGQLGLKVAVAEAERVGGICLNWGCIPTKALLKNAEIYEHVQEALTWGLIIDGLGLDFPKVIKRSRDVSDRLTKGVAALLKKYKCELVSGRGRIARDPSGTGFLVAVTGPDGALQTLSAERVMIATGARPRQIPGLPFDREVILTSREAMTLPEVPKSLLIVGAGAIGVEFAYMYRVFGAKVTLVEMLDHILPVEDDEIALELEKIFRKSGVEVFPRTRVERLERTEHGVKGILQTPTGPVQVEAERALIAIGLQGNVENLGLEELGITPQRSFIPVDKIRYETSVPGIFAIGDVIGPPLLAHVASAEALAAVERIAGHERPAIDYGRIPGCTYCRPQVASIGLTERAAREKGIELKIGRFPFRASGKSLAINETQGFVKILFDAKYGGVVGAHILGSEATEMIAEVGLGMTLETTGREILDTIHAHPTLSEAVMEATGAAYGESINV
jgi:dihydrolipoamide dehydrogenase